MVGEENLAAARGLIKGQGGNTVLIFLMPDPVQGESLTLLVVEDDA